MSTIEDFENAPIGALAYCDDEGMALKVEEPEQTWVVPDGRYLSNVSMEIWGFRLMSARVALDLAWKFAYPVREGQEIPKGTRYLQVHTSTSGLAEFVAQFDFKILPEVVSVVRTLDPLPDPESEWLDAPAVLAATSMCPDRKVWVPESGGVWRCSCCRDELHWYELVDVTPLYPLNEEVAE